MSQRILIQPEGVYLEEDGVARQLENVTGFSVNADGLCIQFDKAEVFDAVPNGIDLDISAPADQVVGTVPVPAKELEL